MEDVSGPHPVALDAEGDVGPQPDRHVGPGRVGGAPVVADHLPFGGNTAVVEVRLADQLHLDLALDAHRRADQEMLPVLVGGGNWITLTPAVAVQVARRLTLQGEFKIPLHRALANRQTLTCPG